MDSSKYTTKPEQPKEDARAAPVRRSAGTRESASRLSGKEDFIRSSLLTNICQMARCGRCFRFPREPALNVFPGGDSDEYHQASWMGDLVRSEIANGKTTDKATLKHLIIPGSHNSASYSIPDSKLCSAIGICQNLTIKEQLLSGIRFLDIRVGSGRKIPSNGVEGSSCSSGVNIFHGPLMGCTFEEVLDEISVFCKEFPSEFVIVMVTAEHKRPFSTADKATALKLMQSHFGSVNDPVDKRLLCNVNSRGDLLNTELQHLIKEKGRVCVLLSESFCRDLVVDGIKHSKEYVKEKYGFCDSYMWIRNKWHNTLNTLELLESNLREIRKHKACIRRYFVNNQFFLTPTVKNLSGLFSGRSSLQPVHLAHKVLYQPPYRHVGRGVPFIDNVFMENPEEDWNIVSLDFVDLTPSITQLLIGMNFSPIEIQLALLGCHDDSRKSAQKEDVTEQIRAKIIRGSCLFLHHLNEFDGKNLDESSLTIVYKFSGKLHSIVVPLSELTNHTIVLSEHNHLLAGGKMLEIEEGTQGNGTINSPRRSAPTLTWQKTEQLSIRFGYLSEDDTTKMMVDLAE